MFHVVNICREDVVGLVTRFVFSIARHGAKSQATVVCRNLTVFIVSRTFWLSGGWEGGGKQLSTHSLK